MDPNDDILTELYSRFTSAKDTQGKSIKVISYDGKDYPVFSVVPKNTEFNYILMNPVELTDDSTKDDNEYECTQLFDIVTFGGERGSWKAANSIGSQLMNLIMKQHIHTSNFKTTVWPTIDNTNHFTEDSEGGLILRKLIRFRYNIQQI